MKKAKAKLYSISYDTFTDRAELTFETSSKELGKLTPLIIDGTKTFLLSAYRTKQKTS